MRRSSALTGPRVRASQANDSGNNCASTQRALAVVGRWRAIGALGVPRRTMQQQAAARHQGGDGWALGRSAAAGAARSIALRRGACRTAEVAIEGSVVPVLYARAPVLCCAHGLQQEKL